MCTMGNVGMGLSPRTRRNLGRALVFDVRRWSISAHAEEPVTRQFGEALRAVYLRVRGGTARHAAT